MKRVLFVDDEPNVLAGLRRILRPFRNDWEMKFVGSADEALGVLAGEPIDVVVTDMRMPGKDGAQLLTEVRANYPSVVRIVLSGQFDHQTALRAAGLAHQFLSKPCEAEALKQTVVRACALRDHLADPTLQRLVSRMNSIPAVPTNYQAILQELNQPEPALGKLGEIIGRDVAMTAKILQLVNSSFFGLGRRVTNATEAATLLGLDTVQGLVLSAGVFSQLDDAALGQLSIDDFMGHSLAVANTAKAIAALETPNRAVHNDAFVAGLLHDVGKLVLAMNFPDRYSEHVLAAADGTMSPSAREYEQFGAAHADVGAYLMALWGLPPQLVEAIAFHHYPAKCPGSGFSPLAAVHVANAIVHARDAQLASDDGLDIDFSYLWQAKLLNRLPAWRATVATPVTS